LKEEEKKKKPPQGIEVNLAVAGNLGAVPRVSGPVSLAFQ
jgi:hypothetical protein